jgi:hypothetical protein
LEREEFDQNRKENLRRYVDNIEEKRRIQDAIRSPKKVHEEWSKGLLYQQHQHCTSHQNGVPESMQRAIATVVAQDRAVYTG